MPKKISEEYTHTHKKIHNPSKYSLDKDSNMINKGLIPLGEKNLSTTPNLTPNLIASDFLIYL